MSFLVTLTLAASLLFASHVIAATGDGGAKTVTLLDRGEPHEALVVNGGLLWVGRSRLDFNAHYKVDAFDSQGTLVDSVELPHSVTFLYPYSATAVLAFGTGHTPNLTQYSIIDYRNGQLRATTTRIPMQAWGNLWAGKIGSLEYFTDMGGNQNDPERDEDFNLPSQTVFSMASGRSPRYLATRIRMPVDGVAVGNLLYIVQKDGIGIASSNLVVVNPATGQGSNIFAARRNGLTKIHNVKGTNLLAVTEREAGLLLLVDAATRETLAEVSDVGNPRSVTSLGNCILTGDAEARMVTYIDIRGLRNGEAPTVLGSLAIGLSVDEFRRLSNVAADASNGKVYVRSGFPCNPMAEVCDKDYNRVAVFTSSDAQKLSASCLAE